MVEEVYVITDLDTGWCLRTEDRKAALRTWWAEVARPDCRDNLTFMRIDNSGREKVWLLGLRLDGHIISGGTQFHATKRKPGGACELPPERPHYKGEM